MDRFKAASDVLTDINKYKKSQLKDFSLITSVCHYFDLIRNEKLSGGDLKFLSYVSNYVGIPHYYDLLKRIQKAELEFESIDLKTFSALLYESTLYTDPEGNIKVHKYQKGIIDSFKKDTLNRYFLSASTSFGKTFLVYEIIKKMDYENIVLIFPTIALLSENLERLMSDDLYHHFKNTYAIHTLSEVEDLSQRNIFIYTPERFLSFIEKNEKAITFNFSFVDEIYKIDNDFIIDEISQENERDVAYRVALHYILKNKSDVLLAGPYIEFSDPSAANYNPSFSNFMRINDFKLLNYNNYELVNKTYSDIKLKSAFQVDEDLKLEFDSKSKEKRLLTVIDSINKIKENCIVYCYSKASVESYAKSLIDSPIPIVNDETQFNDFLNHVSRIYSDNWVLTRALRKGIGIHHGLIPKYIQKEIVGLFNKGFLSTLFTTTTITEGVNTSAKNLIILHSNKGSKPLKKFDAKNISGRAGRFSFHYSGRVIVLDKDFMKIIESKEDGISHKNYDTNSKKDEIDLFYTADEFLNNNDRSRIETILTDQSQRSIPDEIFNSYKVVSRIDKIKVYDNIKKLNPQDFSLISGLIQRINNPTIGIEWEGFDVILNVILPIIKNEKLKFLVEHKVPSGLNAKEYPVLTFLIHYYLQGGFIDSMNYKINVQKESVDKAIRDTAEFIYNILKYQAVKYLGVFNIMYKFVLSQNRNQPYDSIPGIDRLLIKLEYNALTENGRIASDYGVPSIIVDYYENPDQANTIKSRFDKYELEVFERVEKIINKA